MKKTKKTRVFWISRHAMTQEQLADLRRSYGEFEITQWADTVQSVDELRDEILTCDVIAAVLPTELLAQVFHLAQGKPVLQSVAERVLLSPEKPGGETRVLFRHKYWQRITRFEWAAERL